MPSDQHLIIRAKSILLNGTELNGKLTEEALKAQFGQWDRRVEAVSKYIYDEKGLVFIADIFTGCLNEIQICLRPNQGILFAEHPYKGTINIKRLRLNPADDVLDDIVARLSKREPIRVTSDRRILQFRRGAVRIYLHFTETEQLSVIHLHF